MRSATERQSQSTSISSRFRVFTAWRHRYRVRLLAIIIFLLLLCFYRSRKINDDKILALPVHDNFPLAESALSPEDLPPIPKSNMRPNLHAPESTPLFIGFTRNWPLLQQALVSYLTAGWPASDIYIVENTGTMFANAQMQLTLQNPSFMDYRRLKTVFGVNVIRTPTLLSFAQLQNFYIYTAKERNWTHYFWSHMDVIALSLPNQSDPYQTLYFRALSDLRNTMTISQWATRLYMYDRLALVSVSAYEAVGGWDIFIPYYPADWDMYERLRLAGYHNSDARIGEIWDVATTLKDLSIFYQDTPEAQTTLRKYVVGMEVMKNHPGHDRNTWQAQQRGGRGEPYFVNPSGFQKALHITQATSRTIFRQKWQSKRPRHMKISDRWA